jgi:3-methyladenine DNA glycosylase Tag
MKNHIERYRELAGIVESRPAYMTALGEDDETPEQMEERINNLTESELQAEIEGLIAGKAELVARLKASGTFEHYLEKFQKKSPDVKTAMKTALTRSKHAKSHTIHKKLAGLKVPRTPQAAWVTKHQSGGAEGALQRGDTHEKEVSDAGREDRKRRSHAQSAFHHFDTSQMHKAQGNTRKAERHRRAAEAHHARARDPEDAKSGYMYHPQKGDYTNYTPVYDKKSAKAAKNKVSAAALKKKKESDKASRTPGGESATTTRTPWKTPGTGTDND